MFVRYLLFQRYDCLFKNCNVEGKNVQASFLSNKNYLKCLESWQLDIQPGNIKNNVETEMFQHSFETNILLRS